MMARILVVLVVLLLAAPVQAVQNFLILVVDDFGVDKAGCYSSAYTFTGTATPNIDAMATAGIRFDRFAANPLCSATRASIITGRHPYAHGAGGTYDGSDPTVRVAGNDETIVRTLRDAGYWTAAFGKWHLCDAQLGVCDATKQARELGFVHTEFCGSGGDEGCNYYNFSWCTNGNCVVHNEYVTTRQVNEIRAGIIEGNADEPYFIWAAFTAPHGCLGVPSVCPPDDLTPSFNATCTPLSSASSTEACIEALDTELARVFSAVDWSDTCAILIGDNGTLGTALESPHSASHGKGTVYMQGVRVPLIVRGNCVAGSEVGTAGTQSIHVTDISATILDLADGVTWPDPSVPDGISIAPYLAETTTPSIRKVAFTQTFTPDGLPYNPSTSNERATENGTFRLVRHTNGTIEMYDTATDENEDAALCSSGGTPCPGGLTALQLTAYNLMLPALTLPESMPRHLLPVVSP